MDICPNSHVAHTTSRLENNLSSLPPTTLLKNSICLANKRDKCMRKSDKNQAEQVLGNERNLKFIEQLASRPRLLLRPRCSCRLYGKCVACGALSRSRNRKRREAKLYNLYVTCISGRGLEKAQRKVGWTHALRSHFLD